MTTLTDFVNEFKFDDDIRRLPLPESVRKQTGINYDLTMISATQCITRAIFAPNTWTTQEDIINDPAVPFPDLIAIADKLKETE